ncbi:prenyltransferase/squalene oxidase repeat-containing protein [Novipirellula aureliae]|uniref:prenyltransferase/squalene oxidase repeat-containing protein n=1 Tax=Novipirellula aureliae TaxID=2527966 RepID=UPI0011B62F60|nr:prenyltransferase/squalene oxidase repeat-containing protein [Novipirellula aureliae]
MATDTDMTGTTATGDPALQTAGAAIRPDAPPIAQPNAESSLKAVSPLQAEKPTRAAGGPGTIALLVSAIVHTLLLIVLALLSYHVGSAGRLHLDARRGPASADVTFESAIEEHDSSTSTAMSLAEQMETVTIAPAEPSMVSSPLENHANAEKTTDSTEVRTAISASASSQSLSRRLPSGGGLGGRTPTGRTRLGQKYGATAESEQAVERALAWLANHQRRDGSWSFNLELDPCNGRCSHSREPGDTPTPSTAATGLALLAFLGAGYTQHEGKYDKVVKDGLYYLRDVATESEFGLDWQQGSMYGHGIALLALAEALSMSRREGFEDGDTDLRYLTDRGVRFTERAQHYFSGSWGYVPGSPGDTTLTGWQVLSLVAARRSKVTVYQKTFSDAHRFLLEMAPKGEFEFGYRMPKPEPTTTAIGLTLMLYLGHSPYEAPMEESLSKLAKRGPLPNNIYHNYYGTLALHHSRHHGWNEWNRKLRDSLVKTQATVGHEAGSWHFKDHFGDVGGRLYTTAMAAMILEVYYRYMPLYEEIEDFPL